MAEKRVAIITGATRGIGRGRRVEIAEVVEAVMYFLSDTAAAVTGQVMGVNGGMSA